MIGTRAKRVDSAIKVDGRALYGIDTRLPGMKVAAVAISPVLGGKAKAVDEKSALAVKGVRQLVNIDEAVAVVADHMGAAKKGSRPPPSRGTTGRAARSATPISSCNWRRNPKSRGLLPVKSVT